MASMPATRYRPFAPVALPDRTWPDRTLTRAPTWCSVDLRDGNQALVEPMGPERKRRLFELLVRLGFREIEVGFPASSSDELAFVRELIEGERIPDDVTIQVLTQAREDLIRPTLESLRGARRAIVHLYNSTSELQRRVVFGMDRAGVKALAVEGAARIRELAARMPDTEVRLEYSPESFSATELDFALEVCEAVMAAWEPGPGAPIILNLPATVETSTPNVHADQIEWFARSLRDRDSVVLSIHPHNDRGCAVAAAELALLAGADRVEGTLFGNGERTGNVDLVTLALNLYSQGVDPELALWDLPEIVRVAEECTRMPVHPRHPWAGSLVYTAFSGSHQDAIRKGIAAIEAARSDHWEVPYLPIDPRDVGRSYEEVIRINSQSGKGGAAWVLEQHHGLRPPRWLQLEFARVVQAAAEASGGELAPEAIGALFREEYVAHDEPLAVLAWVRGAGGEFEFQVRSAGATCWIRGAGNGPIAAFADALAGALDLRLEVHDYEEHALADGADARAVAYVQVEDAGGRTCGVGLHEDIVLASLRAVASAANRLAIRHAGAPRRVRE
jgi:2-isopropylmalate synthase